MNGSIPAGDWLQVRSLPEKWQHSDLLPGYPRKLAAVGAPTRFPMKQSVVKNERLDDFLGRARKLARLADEGAPIAESIVISFEDPVHMLAVLTPARLAVFRVIKKKTRIDRVDRADVEARPQRVHARCCRAG